MFDDAFEPKHKLMRIAYWNEAFPWPEIKTE